ncbi:MAG: type III polyketide synthase [Bacteroidales bacterium]|nr:type III polyketide synthase [Bacteroidales bacterium]
MGFVLHGLGTALPPGHATQEESLVLAQVLSGPAIRSASWLRGIYKHSGIRTRRQVLGRGLIEDLLNDTRASGSLFLPGRANGPTTGERMALYAEEAPRLAVRAAAAAVTQADFAPDSFTHLVTVSCTGFAAPGVDLALIQELGLRPTVERTQVGFMGCHGALNGLRVAHAYARADPQARVLVCAVELCSLHYHSGDDADKAVANAIFADGAAAVVGTGGDATSEHWQVAATGSCLIPHSATDMHWRIGDHGFEMGLSKRIPGLIVRHLRPWMESWLRENGLSLEEVGSWAVHPGGPKILSAVEESLELPPQATAMSRELYAECGNMSSPTVLFVLDRLRADHAARPCVALGFGPGLVAEAVLFR